MPCVLHLWGKSFPPYGLLMLLGIAAAVLVAYALIKRVGLSFDDFIIYACYAGLFGMLGAKLLYFWVARDLIDWGRLFEPAYFSMLMQGGFVFYGGLIFGTAGIFLASKIHKFRLMPYLAVMAAAFPLAHAFGRVGCFVSGCCYGLPYAGPCSVTYTLPGVAPMGVPLFPVQLLEALINVLLCIVLCLCIVRRCSNQFVICTYLFGYGIARFLLEYLRYDFAERGGFLMFSTSQWISVCLLVGTAAYALWCKKRQTVSR